MGEISILYYNFKLFSLLIALYNVNFTPENSLILSSDKYLI